MQSSDRLRSEARSRGGTLDSGNGEVAPRPVLRGATFAPLAVVFQKSVDKGPESDIALALFVVIFFSYAFGTLIAEWLRREKEKERSEVESELDRDDRRLP